MWVFYKQTDFFNNPHQNIQKKLNVSFCQLHVLWISSHKWLMIPDLFQCNHAFPGMEIPIITVRRSWDQESLYWSPARWVHGLLWWPQTAINNVVFCLFTSSSLCLYCLSEIKSTTTSAATTTTITTTTSTTTDTTTTTTGKTVSLYLDGPRIPYVARLSPTMTLTISDNLVLDFQG